MKEVVTMVCETCKHKAVRESVPIKYFVKVLRELLEERQLKAFDLMLADAWVDDEKVTWVREIP